MDNIFEDSVIRAFENKEFSLLLGCEKKYVEDENGNLLMAPSIRLVGGELDELDPVNFGAVISAMEGIYCKLDKKSGQKVRFKSDLEEAIIDLVKSENPCKVYFATKVYYVLANRSCEDIFYPLMGIDKKIKPLLIQVLKKVERELEGKKIYEGKYTERGLWDILRFYDGRANDNVKLKIFGGMIDGFCRTREE